jgi:PPOX class probable F420-dependent enzyme
MNDHIAEPAQPTVLTERIRRFLTAPHTAALATVGADGAPHQTFIWYGLEPDDTILVNSLVGRRWPAELQRDGRAALAIANVANQLSWVGVTARVIAVDDDRERALADILALAHRYQEHPTPEYLDGFRSQQRITLRLRITAVHDHLRAPDL